VEIHEQPAMPHTVNMRDFRKWLDMRPISPAQVIAKDKIRAMWEGLEPNPLRRRERR